MTKEVCHITPRTIALLVPPAATMDASPPSYPLRRRYSNDNDKSQLKRHASMNSTANSSISTRSYHALHKRPIPPPPAAPLLKDRWAASLIQPKNKTVKMNLKKKKKSKDPLAGYDVQVMPFLGPVMRPMGGIPIVTQQQSDDVTTR